MTRAITAVDVLASIQGDSYQEVGNFIRRFNDCMGTPKWANENKRTYCGPVFHWWVDSLVVHSDAVIAQVTDELKYSGWEMLETNHTKSTNGTTWYLVTPII